MAIEVPKTQKIYTTQYEDFRGVDFTNDPSNVWYRRTPDGVNMLPDEAGRPFKRTGWTIAVSAQDMADLYAEDTSSAAPSEVTVNKCYYFELSGEDHIVIFTNIGVFFYRGGELYSSKSLDADNVISYDQDMIDSYERSFFFEGNGKAAFYTYGGFKIWEYGYDDEDGFTWKEVKPYIPRVNIGVDARHEKGTGFEEVNMLSDYICEEFENDICLAITSQTTNVTGATLSVDTSTFVSVAIPPSNLSGYPVTYEFVYSRDDHSWLLDGDQVLLSTYGVSINANPLDEDYIRVTVNYAQRVNLPRRILGIDGMEVYASTSTQFDTKLTLESSATHTSYNYCTLVTPSQTGNSHLVFYKDWLPLVDGEDCIRVVYPRNAITAQVHTSSEITISVGAT